MKLLLVYACSEFILVSISTSAKDCIAKDNLVRNDAIFVSCFIKNLFVLPFLVLLSRYYMEKEFPSSQNRFLLLPLHGLIFHRLLILCSHFRSVRFPIFETSAFFSHL